MYSQFGQKDEDEAKLSKKRRDSESPKKPSTPEKRRATLPPVQLAVADLATNGTPKDEAPSVISKSVSEDEPTSPNVQSPVAKSMSAVADKIASVLADSSTETEESMRVYYGKISK